MERVEEAWQRVAKAMVEVEKALADFQPLHLQLTTTEGLSIKAQELFGLATMQSEITLFMERMTRFAYVNGGLEFLLLPEESKAAKRKSKSTDDSADEDTET